MPIHEDAARRLSGEESAEKACDHLHKAYKSRYTIVTAGREGSFIMYDGHVWHIPALGGPGVDSTGAGDSFVGALVYYLSNGDDLIEASRKANHVAAISVTRMGAMPSLPGADEI